MRKSPYLIQRGSIKKEPSNQKGLDSIIRWDYMGSAEFEFGALPASLTQIRNAKPEYEKFNIRVCNRKDRIVSVYCKASERVEVIEVIDRLAQNLHRRLKECSRFDDWFNDKKSNIDFWWDIENDFMFWVTGDGQFDNRFLEVI